MEKAFTLPKIGDILVEEFLEPLEITPYRLAKDLGVSTSSILDLVHNKKEKSPWKWPCAFQSTLEQA